MIGEQVTVDDVGELPFEAAAGFLGSLGFDQLALVVGLPWAGVADLADRDQVQGGIELAVAGPVQPMAANITAGGLDRGGAGVAGEVVAAGESGDVAGVAEQFGGQHGADPKTSVRVVPCSRTAVRMV